MDAMVSPCRAYSLQPRCGTQPHAQTGIMHTIISLIRMRASTESSSISHVQMCLSTIYSFWEPGKGARPRRESALQQKAGAMKKPTNAAWPLRGLPRSPQIRGGPHAEPNSLPGVK